MSKEYFKKLMDLEKTCMGGYYYIFLMGYFSEVLNMTSTIWETNCCLSCLRCTEERAKLRI